MFVHISFRHCKPTCCHSLPEERVSSMQQQHIYKLLCVTNPLLADETIESLRRNAYRNNDKKVVKLPNRLATLRSTISFETCSATIFINESFVCKRRKHLQAKPKLVRAVLPCVCKVVCVSILFCRYIYKQNNNT